MKVRLDPSLLEDGTMWDALDAIIPFFQNQRHMWIIEDPEEIIKSQWIQTDLPGRSGQKKVDTLKKCFTNAIYPHPRIHAMETMISKDTNILNQVYPSNALTYLGTPACVVVENAESDGTFLEAMMHAFKRQTLMDAQTDGWWQFEHLGGFGEVEKRVEQIRTRTHGPLRVFVLADSDRLAPGLETATEKKIRRYCESCQVSVPFAILKKRKIENYLPDQVLQHGVKEKAKYDAFLQLNQEQKDFYDMKNGFKKDDKNNVRIAESQVGLFSNQPKQVIENLQGGFGKNIWELFKTSRSDFTQEAIRGICPQAPDEIEQILNAIESLI